MSCKGCTERTPDCHSTCERYAEFLKANEVVKQKRKMYEMSLSREPYKRGSMLEKRKRK